MASAAALASLVAFEGPQCEAFELGFVAPANGWRQLKTVNFTVLYSRGQDSIAQRIANISETVHAGLIPFLRWSPDGRTTVVVTDNSDQANALTAPLPRRTIVLNLSQPAGEPGNYQDWLYEVLVHEYAHILQTDMVSGVPAAIQSALGRLYLPNFIQPLHQIEGLAVYAETEFTGFGRNRSAYYDGVLRSFVNENKWPALDQVAVFSPRWPGDAPYLFGGKFFEYLAARFGRDKVAMYQRKHSRLVWPFLQSWVAQDVFGAGFGTLWRQWRDRCQVDYRAQIDSILSAGGPISARLTANGCGKSNLAISPDRHYLAWIEETRHSLPSLRLYDLRTGAGRTIHQGYLSGSLCFSPDGNRIVFGKREYADAFSPQYDLYLIDLRTEKISRLTRGLRAHDPAWSPDGQTILFVRDSLGANALASVDLRSGTVSALTGYDAGSRYSHPSFSPDGARAALSVWCEGGFHDIYLLELAPMEFRPLLVDRAQELSPVWSADGRSILFASDRTGIWNAFRYDLDSNRLCQLTNAVGGSLCPVADSGNILYGLDMSADGFNLSKTVIDSGIGQPAEAFTDSLSRAIPILPGTVYPPRPYRPLSSMTPYFWFPAGFADERGGALGLACLGSDQLLQLNYQLSAGYNSGNGRPAYQFSITDASRPLMLSLYLSDRAVRHDVSVQMVDTAYWDRQQTQVLGAEYLHRKAAYQIIPSIAYRHDRLSGLNDVLPGGNPFWTGDLASIRLSCLFANAKKYGWSISPEHGRALYGEAEFYRNFLGSEISQTIVWGRWSEYINLPIAHHVLLLDSRMGAWKAKEVSFFETNSAFDLRGYPISELHNSYRACATAEYRFPLLWVERGYQTWPLYWKSLHGALYAEAGVHSRTGRGLSRGGTKRGIGAELRSDWLVSYALPAHALIGYAHAIDRPRRDGVYWMIALEL